MRCLPELTLSDDEPFWVSREVFFEKFDQEDFLCRESPAVALSYLTEWFHMPSDGIQRFMLPTVQFVAGKTQFINGRHRTAVLLQCLDEIPFAFYLADKVSKNILDQLVLRPLSLQEFIDMPDLPIVESLSEI